MGDFSSNSSIFISSTFGYSSGKSVTELIDTDRSTQEKYLQQSPNNKMDVSLPRVPSNQRIAKDN